MEKPYLLSPCGSPESLRAAVFAGADECYFGGSANNARMNAKGFSQDEFCEALKFLRLYGVRSNITLNTLMYDREMEDAVSFAKDACSMGADAFIVQDIGLAKLLSIKIPGIRLHASTQCACHSLDGAIKLSELGFSRIVLARELPFSEIARITEYGREKGNFETEVFVHGALCVSHSGMCLMSSVIGGRSGNRGLCAQPCRMTGIVSCGNANSKTGYPLSLHDLSLSGHIDELIKLGVAALKIEGRMKSPEYVYSVTKTFRKLLDEKRNASGSEFSALSDIFSRGGFTDAYFTGKYLSDNRKMYGIRSESDKEKTALSEVQIPKEMKIPAKLRVVVKRGKKPFASICARGFFGEYSLSEITKEAKNSPLTRDALVRNMSKLGSTPFELSEITCELDDGLFLASSEINALRRGAVENLTSQILKVDRICEDAKEPKKDCAVIPEKRNGGAWKLRFFTDNPDLEKDSRKYPQELESICLPLAHFKAEKKEIILPKVKFGVRLPRVIFDSERENVLLAVKRAKELGASYTYISNIGHFDIAKESGLPIFGGMGLNVTNSEALLEYSKMGLECITLSPELKTAQMRDITRVEGVNCAVVCEGRLPLMVLESCIVRGSLSCTAKEGSICGEYVDRMKKRFPIYREERFLEGGKPCRNIILNADVLNLYSKKEELSKTGADILEIYLD